MPSMSCAALGFTSQNVSAVSECLAVLVIQRIDERYPVWLYNMSLVLKVVVVFCGLVLQLCNFEFNCNGIYLAVMHLLFLRKYTVDQFTALVWRGIVVYHFVLFFIYRQNMIHSCNKCSISAQGIYPHKSLQAVAAHEDLCLLQTATVHLCSTNGAGDPVFSLKWVWTPCLCDLPQLEWP